MRKKYNKLFIRKKFKFLMIKMMKNGNKNNIKKII